MVLSAHTCVVCAVIVKFLDITAVGRDVTLRKTLFSCRCFFNTLHGTVAFGTGVVEWPLQLFCTDWFSLPLLQYFTWMYQLICDYTVLKSISVWKLINLAFKRQKWKKKKSSLRYFWNNIIDGRKKMVAIILLTLMCIDICVFFLLRYLKCFCLSLSLLNHDRSLIKAWNSLSLGDTYSQGWKYKIRYLM